MGKRDELTEEFLTEEDLISSIINNSSKIAESNLM